MKGIRDSVGIGERAIERVREARRTVGRERHYQCSGCGFDRHSRVDLRDCPSCGTGMAAATITRTLLA
jgi:ribosomal protein L37AE/L43A